MRLITVARTGRLIESSGKNTCFHRQDADQDLKQKKAYFYRQGRQERQGKTSSGGATESWQVYASDPVRRWSCLSIAALIFE